MYYICIKSMTTTSHNKKTKGYPMDNQIIVPNSENNISSLVEVNSVIHTESDLPNIGGDLDAFLPINKVPLSTDMGGYSKAHSVRLEKDGKEVEMGVVGKDYLLVPNKELMDVASEIMGMSNLNFKPTKKFFNGKQFRYVWQIDDAGLQVEVPKVGDIVGLVMEVINSYDRSTKAGILCYFMRLDCLNGMRSKTYQFGYSFRHTLNNELDWQSEINQSVIQLTGNNPQYMLNQFSEACGKLQKPIDFQELKLLSENNAYLGKLPTQQYGQIVKNMLVSEEYPQSGNEFTAWDLLNSGTQILWHQKKITQGAIKNNALVVDGLLQYGKDTYDEPFVDINQTNIFKS